MSTIGINVDCYYFDYIFDALRTVKIKTIYRINYLKVKFFD